jgi:hypothetical protein
MMVLLMTTHRSSEKPVDEMENKKGIFYSPFFYLLSLKPHETATLLYARIDAG